MAILSEQICHGKLTLNIIRIASRSQAKGCNHGYKNCLFCLGLTNEGFLSVPDFLGRGNYIAPELAQIRLKFL